MSCTHTSVQQIENVAVWCRRCGAVRLGYVHDVTGLDRNDFICNDCAATQATRDMPCVKCGSPRLTLVADVGKVGDWQLPESEQRAVREAAMCPICEFGDPLPVETKFDEELKIDLKVWRWTCGHWISEKPRTKEASS